MNNQNIMKEILGVEDEANNIIYEAKKKARQIELEMGAKVDEITKEIEKDFNDKIAKLKEEIQATQNEEEKRLREEFEENKKKLKQVGPKAKERMVDLVFKKICEVD